MTNFEEKGRLVSPFRPIKYQRQKEKASTFINRQMELFKRTAKDVYQFKVYQGNEGDFPKIFDDAVKFGLVCREIEELLDSHYSEPMETTVTVPVESLFFRVLKLYHTFRVYVPRRYQASQEESAKACIPIALDRLKKQNANLYQNGVIPLLSNMLFLARDTRVIAERFNYMNVETHEAYGRNKRNHDYENRLLVLRTMCLEILTLLRFSYE